MQNEGSSPNGVQNRKNLGRLLFWRDTLEDPQRAKNLIMHTTAAAMDIIIYFGHILALVCL